MTLQNYSISSELSSTPDRPSSLRICTRAKIQRKPSLPPTHQYGLQHKNINLILCILLAGDIAINPGPVNTNFNNSDGTFSMFYQNVRSLKSTYWDNSSNTKESKLSCFHDVVMANQFDIIALTETWLDSWILNHELLPIGYNINIFRHDREGKRGGGVLLAIKESIKTDQFNFTSQSLGIVSVVVNSMSKNVLVCVCYRPPNAGIEFHQEFERFLNVLGDFNFPSIY